MAELQLEEVQALVRHFLAGGGSVKELAQLHQALAEDSAVALELVAQVQEAFENRPPAKLSPLQVAQVQARVDALIVPLIRYNGVKGRLKKLLGRTKAATRNGYVEPQAAEVPPVVTEAPVPAVEPPAEPLTAEEEAPALSTDRPASDPPVLAEAEEAPPGREPETSEPEAPEPEVPGPEAVEPRTLDIEAGPSAKPRTKALALVAGVILVLLGAWLLSRRQAPPPPPPPPIPAQAAAALPSPVLTPVPTLLPQRAAVSQPFDGLELPMELPPLTPMPAGYYRLPAP